jgi:hypothetical protein
MHVTFGMHSAHRPLGRCFAFGAVGYQPLAPAPETTGHTGVRLAVPLLKLPVSASVRFAITDMIWPRFLGTDVGTGTAMSVRTQPG